MDRLAAAGSAVVCHICRGGAARRPDRRCRFAVCEIQPNLSRSTEQRAWPDIDLPFSYRHDGDGVVYVLLHHRSLCPDVLSEGVRHSAVDDGLQDGCQYVGGLRVLYLASLRRSARALCQHIDAGDDNTLSVSAGNDPVVQRER